MHTLRGTVSFAIFACYTLVGCFVVYLISIAQLFCPVPHWRRQLRGLNDGVITAWVFLNEKMCHLFRWIQIDTSFSSTLTDRNHWWLIVSNHQSWADILILEFVFRKLAPPIKFFAKRELIWLPFLGFGLWLLRFPLVRRGRRATGKSRQQLREQRQQELQRSATQFHERPISLLLFLEGTRFTAEKHSNQSPPYRHLLRPKLGGLSFTLEALASEIDHIVNVTINYSGTAPGFWELLCGRCSQVSVHVGTIPVTADLLQDLKSEITTAWQEKDRLLTELRT